MSAHLRHLNQLLHAGTIPRMDLAAGASETWRRLGFSGDAGGEDFVVRVFQAMSCVCVFFLGGSSEHVVDKLRWRKKSKQT